MRTIARIDIKNQSVIKKKFDKQKFYYVHSYIAEPIDEKNEIASYVYNGNIFLCYGNKKFNKLIK